MFEDFLQHMFICVFLRGTPYGYIAEIPHMELGIPSHLLVEKVGEAIDCKGILFHFLRYFRSSVFQMP